MRSITRTEKKELAEEQNSPERKEKGKTVQQTVHSAAGSLCRISVDGRDKSVYCHLVGMEGAAIKKQPVH